MGKARKSRKHAPAVRSVADPTGLASALLSDPSGPAATAAAAQEQAVQQQQLLSKLSGTPVQKAVACSAIAHILSNHLSPAASVVTPPLLRALVPLLLERQSFDVAISAAGAVRNISAIGGKQGGNMVLSHLLNSDACTVLISLLEAAKTEWLLALPEGQHTSATAASASSTMVHLASTPSDKRAHFLTQLISALANLSEHFDAALTYFTANTAAVAHLLQLLLDDSALGATPSFHGVALQVEISNLLLLVSESNAEFVRCLNRLPAEFGGVQGIVTRLLQKIENGAVSPQVRVQCAGILLNMQPTAALVSLSSPASAHLALPGTPNAQAASGEQLCLTSVLATLSNLLDLNPLKLGEELVTQLRADRVQVDAQLAAVEQGRVASDEAHLKEAAERYKAKQAAKQQQQQAGGDDNMMEAEENKDNAAAPTSGSDDSAAAALAAAEEEEDILFADAHDEIESTHKDAQGAAHSAAASTSKKSPEVVIAAQWTAHLEEKLNQYRQFLLSIRIALELLTNLASSPEEDEDISDTDSDASFSGQLDANQLGYIPKLVLHLGVLQKIMLQCQLHIKPATPSSDASSSPSPSSSLHSALTSIFPPEEVEHRIVDLVDEVRGRAIGALNNLVLFLPNEVLPPLAALFHSTCELMANIMPAYQTNNAEAVEEMGSLASLLFQIARKDCNALNINKAVISMLLQLARPETAAASSSSSSLPVPSSPSSPKRGVQLHVLGLLSLLGSKVAEAQPFNFLIGSVLLECVKHAGQAIQHASATNTPSLLHIHASSDETNFLECASEALNGVIDLYSEDNQHVENQKNLAMVATLEAFLPLFNQAIKVLQSQRNPKVPRELIQRLQENALNTKEFVKYKKQHL